MKQSKIKIAVTGGIGSGKTTVCKILQSHGKTVLSCDEIYSELLEGDELKEILVQTFGNEIIKEGRVDRAKLSSLVFSDKQKLQKLNSITHPLIFSEMFKRAEGVEGIKFFEVPLLFEGGYQTLFDAVIVVLRDKNTRTTSVATRDRVSEESVKKRILNQHNYDFTDFSQYYVIHNDGNFDDLEQNVVMLLKNLECNFGL